MEVTAVLGKRLDVVHSRESCVLALMFTAMSTQAFALVVADGCLLAVYRLIVRICFGWQRRGGFKEFRRLNDRLYSAEVRVGDCEFDTI